MHNLCKEYNLGIREAVGCILRRLKIPEARRKRFREYKTSCMSPIREKFATAIRNAVDGSKILLSMSRHYKRPFSPGACTNIVIQHLAFVELF